MSDGAPDELRRLREVETDARAIRANAETRNMTGILFGGQAPPGSS
jgi:hypothetical protein